MISLDKKKKRLAEIQNALDAFKENQNGEIEFIDNAAKKLNNWYWKFIDENVKVHFENSKNSRINIFKICSSLELAIIYVQPIKVKNDIRRGKNSEFAFLTAFRFLTHWFNFKEASDLEELASFIEVPHIKQFIANHKLWLSKLEPQFNYPTFSNSHTWTLFYYLLCNHTNRSIEVYSYH